MSSSSCGHDCAAPGCGYPSRDPIVESGKIFIETPLDQQRSTLPLFGRLELVGDSMISVTSTAVGDKVVVNFVLRNSGGYLYTTAADNVGPIPAGVIALHSGGDVYGDNSVLPDPSGGFRLRKGSYEVSYTVGDTIGPTTATSAGAYLMGNGTELPGTRLRWVYAGGAAPAPYPLAYIYASNTVTIEVPEDNFLLNLATVNAIPDISSGPEILASMNVRLVA